MSEVGIGDVSKNGTEKLIGQELQREVEQVWNNKNNWKEGKDVSLEVR